MTDSPTTRGEPFSIPQFVFASADWITNDLWETRMAIVVKCPNPACGTKSPAGDEVNGKTVRCKKCGTSFLAQMTFDGAVGDTQKSQSKTTNDPFPELPVEFGRYRILKQLGRGGMGAVYLAKDLQLDRDVALKIPFFEVADAAKLARFSREARSAAGLHHPNICTVYDSGQIDGKPFITMAFIPGKPLEDMINPAAPLPEDQVAEIVSLTARALEYAHSKGIVHRDLKPANIMI